MAAGCCLTVGLLAVVPSRSVGGDSNGLDLREFKPALVAPVEELLDRARVGHARVAVADAGGEEFDEAAAGALAARTNDGRQSIEPSTHQRRRRRESALVLEAYSVSHGKASAYLPVLELLKQYFGIALEDECAQTAREADRQGTRARPRAGGYAALSVHAAGYRRGR